MLVYQRLRSLQGQYIPRYYGEAISGNGVPAFILEHVKGAPLYSMSLEQLASPKALNAIASDYWKNRPCLEDLLNPTLLSALRETYQALTANGVKHGDPLLANFIFDGKKVVAIDFERSSLPPGGSLTEEYLREVMEANEKGLTEVMETIEARVEAQAPKAPMARQHWIPPDWPGARFPPTSVLMRRRN
jgi:hypothetical protein